MSESLVTLVVGGVPEHFNYPWHLASERKLFEKHGIKIDWRDQKGGTGAQLEGLKSGNLEVVTALTEGLVGSLAKGSTEFTLVGTYVESPLCWAISTGPSSKFHQVSDLQDQNFGISRHGSGSELMAYVLALQNGWDPKKLSFTVENNFEGLRKSVCEGKTAAFLWETFTTKPFHDSGEVKRIGDITTPWPCFLIAVNTETLKTKRKAIQDMLTVIRESCQLFHQEKDQMIQDISSRYGLKTEDAQQWYQGVKISADKQIKKESLNKALDALHQAGVLPNTSEHYKLESFVDSELSSLI